MKKIYLILLGFYLFEIASAQSPKNLALLGSLQFPGQTLAGCWHYNDSTGKEYALIGAANGIVIADITDPSNPTQLFQLPGAKSTWHEVKVQGDFAYAVSEGSDANGIKNGVQIIDLRFLPDSAPNKFYYGDGSIANQLVTAHSITTAGHYVYVNGHNIFALGQGVLILDITNPLFPVYVGAITNRYCHDSYVRGDTIYTSDIHAGLFSVYDISDRANPILLATQITPGQFTHSTWLSDDGHTNFTADERTGTPVAAYDITDLNNITLLDTFYNGNFTNREVHNVRIKNDFLINPSYGSQLTLADVSRPGNIIEIGNFVTGNFLCWDADPFTNSGNILATDMNNQRLYIFSPTYLRACYLEGTVTDSITSLPISGATIKILPLAITKTTNFSGEYRTGYADSGSYNVSYSKANYISQQLTVSLHNGILTTLNVQLVPIETGIQDISGRSLNIFPNPANDVIHISSLEFTILKWQLKDECGRVINQSDTKFNQSKQFSININFLPAGIYTATMQSSTIKFEKTFIKN